MKNEPSYAELDATFRYEDGKLFRIDGRSGQWKMVDISKANHNGYVCVSFRGKMLRAHRIIYSLVHKVDISTDMEIDHTNGNKIDNHIGNLELVTHRENQQNQTKHREGRLCGCTFCKREQKWRAQIQINGKNKHLGYFPTEIQAHQAYLDAVGMVEFGTTVDANKMWEV